MPEGVPVPPPGMLDSYRSGHREQVWHELRQLGVAARDPDRALDAQAVCDEMARRARYNIELIVGRLTEAGYRFHTNDNEPTPVRPNTPPSSDAPALTSWLEQRFGPVPMTLLAWARIVGDVWLVGTHPQWPDSAGADPFVLEVEGSRYPGASMQAYFDGEFDAWQDARTSGDESDLFVLPLAPDRLHKNNVSGGPPYGIIVPDGCADGLFVGETPIPFVAYLNHVFDNGGFPGPTAYPGAWQIKQSLARDLLPL